MIPTTKYQGIFKPQISNSKLEMKLNSALKYVIHSCLFGSSNKIEDIEKTNGLTLFRQFRYNGSGQYLSKRLKEPTAEDDLVNSQYEHHNGKFKTLDYQWYFHTDDFKNADGFDLMLKCRMNGIDPLDDYKFSFNKKNMEVLQIAMLAMEKYQGNCFSRACLLAKYLLENNAGISRIEIVPMTTFDHAILIVNRTGTINDPTTWGDAWIIDSWYQDNGIIFHASEFQQQIKKIKSFAKKEIDAIKKLGLASTGVPFQDTDEVPCKSLYDINPSIYLYPTYSISPFYPLEFYYYLDYPKDLVKKGNSLIHLQKNHQKQFKDCLSELTTAEHDTGSKHPDIVSLYEDAYEYISPQCPIL